MKDKTAFGLVIPCPQSIRQILYTWFASHGFGNVPLSQIAAQLIIRWEDQLAHYDDMDNICDIITLDIASAGGLKIMDPPHLYQGSYCWRGYSAKGFKHRGFVGLVPSSTTKGRIALVFRTYAKSLSPIPMEGNVLNQMQCNEVLNEQICKEISAKIQNVDDPFLNLFQICAKLITVGKSLASMCSGGYGSGLGIGYAPSSNGIVGSMNLSEKIATFPGLKLGDKLPDSFYLPYGSFEFLWTFGFHRLPFGNTVYAMNSIGLLSVALKRERVYLDKKCCLIQTSLQSKKSKNILCSQGCCAGILLPKKDKTVEGLQRLSIAVNHSVYFYLLWPDCSATAQRVLSFSVHMSKYLLLKLVPSPSVSHITLPYKCLGIESDPSLVEYATRKFQNGIILRSYQLKKYVNQSIYVGHVSNGVIEYNRCNNAVGRENDLCEKCLENQAWLRENQYNTLKRKRSEESEKGSSSSIFTAKCETTKVERKKV